MPALAAAVLLVAGPLAAQTGSLRGTVRSTTDEPLSSPAVTLLGLGVRTLGDSSGSFSFRDVPAGTWRLEVRRLGYRTATVPFTVREGAATHVTVQDRKSVV